MKNLILTLTFFASLSQAQAGQVLECHPLGGGPSGGKATLLIQSIQGDQASVKMKLVNRAIPQGITGRISAQINRRPHQGLVGTGTMGQQNAGITLNKMGDGFQLSISCPGDD